LNALQRQQIHFGAIAVRDHQLVARMDGGQGRRGDTHIGALALAVISPPRRKSACRPALPG
jgi:hypothetical protein